MASIYRTRNLFLRCMAGVYLCAFASFYLQIRALYGSDGILPARAELNLKDSRHFLTKFWEKPTLLHLAPMIGLNVQYSAELLSLVAIVMSLAGIVLQNMCNLVNFSMLWLSYVSLYEIGQTFIYFQWDILLMEAGIITILVAPLTYSKPKVAMPKDHITFWLVKWLLFRLMFASGVVKLTSRCPLWWNLTALTVHYESQCIPTTLAWYAHHFPVWWHKLCVVATLVIEIQFPFLFFAPFRQLRLIAFYGQILLQALIVASGNYNFFNLLTVTLCLSLLDDRHLYSSKPTRPSTVEKLSTAFVIFLHLYLLHRWYGVDFGRQDGELVHSEIKFTLTEFDEAIKLAVPTSIVIGCLSFGATVLSSLYELIFQSKMSLFGYSRTAGQFVVYLFVTFFVFAVSLVPYTSLDRPTNIAIPNFVHRWHGHYKHFHVSGSYGLFRSMTGASGRPELILEGSMKLEGPWIEIPFKYKPGDVDRGCPYITPYQPRLDWQMWFAALGNYHQNPWLTSLAYRLLSNQSDVVQLLDTVGIRNSFGQKKWPPKYIKGSLYKYRYTSLDEKKNWWRRTRTDDYLPIFSVDHQPLIDYLIDLKILNHKDVPARNVNLTTFLDYIWDYTHSMDPHVVLWGLLLTGIVISRIK